MKIKKIKKMMATMMAVVCLAGIMPGTAFAYYDAAADTTTETETSVTDEQETVAPEETEGAATETEVTAMEPLTPEGNLTLVDDEGSASDVGKQFITLVTKNGNYFYLIIDRDAKGEQTVHFLNQVDESDLLALMDEDEAKAYEEEKKESVEVPVELETPAEQPSEEQKPAEKKGKVNILSLVSLLVLAVGGGAYGFMTWQSKKKQEKEAASDPDADYVEEEEYLVSDEEEETEESK